MIVSLVVLAYIIGMVATGSHVYRWQINKTRKKPEFGDLMFHWFAVGIYWPVVYPCCLIGMGYEYLNRKDSMTNLGEKIVARVAGR